MPRLRRLRHPEGRAEGDGQYRRRPGEYRVRLRHRLRSAVSVLHGDLRVPYDPRPRAELRDRNQAGQPGPRRLGRRRRRRRALHRRQPHAARHPPQRRHQLPAVQQRDLRADQGPVFADLAARHPLALHAPRFDRFAGQRAELRARRQRPLRRPRHRSAARSSARPARPRPRPQGLLLRRDHAELHRLQRRRVRAFHRERR